MKKQELKKLIRECLQEVVTSNNLTIDIEPHNGLLYVEKNESGIELVADDVEEIIKFYGQNKDKIARAEEFTENAMPVTRINEGPVTKQDFVAFANGIKNLRYMNNGQPHVPIEDVVDMCVSIFKQSNPQFDEARFRAACK